MPGRFGTWLSIAVLVLLPVLVQAQSLYEVNFEETPLEDFIDSVGRITGKTFIVDPRVKGTVTVRSAQPLATEAVYDVFLAQLRAQGFAAVELPNGQVKVLPDQAARLEPLPVELAGEARNGRNDGIATRVFTLRDADSAQLMTILQPLIDPKVGVLTPFPASNLLVVTDWRSNLDRIDELVRRLDRVSEEPLEVMHLRYIEAGDTAALLNKLVQRSGGEGDASGPLVVADSRNNALLVRGGDALRGEVRALLGKLDLPQEQAANTEVIYLRHAAAADVVEVLRNLAQGGDGAEGLDAEGTVTSSYGATPLSGRVRLEADQGTNSIVIVGPKVDIDAYRSIVDKLDIRRAQVVVETIIAEISDSRASQLGVQWLFWDSSGSNLPVAGTNFGNTTSLNALGAAAVSGDNTALGNLLSGMEGISAGVGRIGNGLSFAALLNALQSESGFNLLSTPTLLTLDNAEASILVGQEVPFLTGSVTQNNANPYQTIERKDVGVKLTLKPQINEGNTVRLDLVQEVSSISNEASASDVITNKREISTTVMVEDNGLVVLGGLISDEVNETRQKVPLLGDLPGVGGLFRSDSRSHTKRHLLVFIRPRIVRDPLTLKQLSREKYRDIRQAQQMREGEAMQASVALDRELEAGWQQLFPSARARLGDLR